ncbi:MAG TPA: hypothetical protein VK871_12355 [Candidatus Limnocylindrales bacterium]|nr:hypothetical protein [Candidatus Limnocylindrales bacterium]
MSGYAATARIERVRPRFTLAHSSPDFATFGRVRPQEQERAAETNAELADTLVRDTLLDRFQAARDRWSQLTFYLFDAEGWR